jgi:hypothetical protein
MRPEKKGFGTFGVVLLGCLRVLLRCLVGAIINRTRSLVVDKKPMGWGRICVRGFVWSFSMSVRRHKEGGRDGVVWCGACPTRHSSLLW